MATTPRSSADLARVLFGGDSTEPRQAVARTETDAETDTAETSDTELEEATDDQEGGETMPRVPKKSHAEILFGGNPEQYLNIGDNVTKLADHEGLTVAQQDAERKEFAALALNELQLEPGDARRLHDVITKRRLDGGSDTWTAQTRKWAVQSRRELRERLGTEDAERVQADIAGFVKAKPQLAKWLEGGVAEHPDVVPMLASAVRRSGRRALS